MNNTNNYNILLFKLFEKSLLFDYVGIFLSHWR